MPITDWDDAVNKCSGGNNGNPQPFFSYKYDLLDGAVAPGLAGSSRYQSLWQMVGWPTHGSAPGAVAVIPTSATSGALGQANASGGRTLYLNSISSMTQLTAGELVLADRLATISGLDATVTTAQTITGLAVTRYTGTESVGNEIWIEIYAAIGVSATTIKASYTNQAGTAGQVTPLVGIGGVGLDEAQGLIRLPLASGDSGVRSVESITFTAGTGTAGNVGVTIMRHLSVIEFTSVRAAELRNLLGPDFPPVPIKDNACLFFYMANLTTSTIVVASQFIEA